MEFYGKVGFIGYSKGVVLWRRQLWFDCILNKDRYDCNLRTDGSLEDRVEKWYYLVLKEINGSCERNGLG